METSNKKNNSALILIFLCMAVYLSSYIARKAYDSNINNIIDYYRVGDGTAGLVGTCFFIAYALGQVVHGIFCKRYPKKWSIPLACTVSATMTMLMGLVSVENFWLMKFFWFVNGFCLASLWPSFVLIFATTLAQMRKGQAIAIMALPVSVGTFICYGLSSLFTLLDNFQLLFFVGAGLLYAVSLVWVLLHDKLVKGCLAERKELDGIPENGYAEQIVKKTEKPAEKTKIFTFIVLLIFFFAIIDNFVKDGINTWSQKIFKDKYGLENWFSTLISLCIPLCAVFGSFTALFMSKKIKKPVLILFILFAVATAVLGLLIPLFNYPLWVIPLVCFMFVSAIMAAINNEVTSIFPMTCIKGGNAGLIAGLADGFCYVGSAASSYGLGAISDATNDWNVVLWVLFGACLLALVCSGLYSLYEKLKEGKKAANN